jgi:ribulose-5-phosphate 4-epimerase/fuculose-1-phosphate aldolase
MNAPTTAQQMQPVDGAARPPHCSDEEWALRCQLADGYHLIDYFGWTETIFNHISVRLPSGDYLVNPFGLNYDEITPANLLKVGLDGKLVEPSPYAANPAGFALHSAIHGARDDAHCVVHTHTTPISAIAMKRAGFGHDDFYGAQLTGRVAYHAFEGITLFEDEKQRMLQSLGDKHVLVLRNHGVAVCEADVPRTFFLLWTVQRAAEVQCLALSMAGDNVALPESIGRRCAELTEQLITGNHEFAEKWFAAMVRKSRARRRATSADF